MADVVQTGKLLERTEREALFDDFHLDEQPDEEDEFAPSTSTGRKRQNVRKPKSAQKRKNKKSNTGKWGKTTFHPVEVDGEDRVDDTAYPRENWTPKMYVNLMRPWSKE